MKILGDVADECLLADVKLRGDNEPVNIISVNDLLKDGMTNDEPSGFGHTYFYSTCTIDLDIGELGSLVNKYKLKIVFKEKDI